KRVSADLERLQQHQEMTATRPELRRTRSSRNHISCSATELHLDTLVPPLFHVCQSALGVQHREAGWPRTQPLSPAHERADRLDELTSRTGKAAIAPVREADRARERIREPHRAQRTPGFDHQAGHDSHAEARRRKAEYAVHLATLESESRLEPRAPEGRERRRAQVIAVAEHHEGNALEISHTYRLARRERVVSGDGDNELLAQERRRLEHLMPQRQDHECDVERPLLELTHEVTRARLVEHEIDTGKCDVEARERRRQQRRGERRRRADSKPTK